jgi:adenylate cyclase 10
MEGSLNKVVAYDRGLTIIACWGLSPYSHDDDAARAVYAAQNIQKKINRLGKISTEYKVDLPLNVGISTGSVFMGIIGNDGGRKEIVILSEVMERAFLFMQTSMKV